MKTGITLPELAFIVKTQNENKVDFLADTRSLSMIPGADGVRLGLNDQEFAISRVAHEQISEASGIPKRYYDRMLASCPDLLADNVTHWWRNEPARRMVRTLSDQTSARAVLSDTYRRLDNFDLVNAALPALVEASPNWKVESCQITDHKLYIKAVFPMIQSEIRKVGDVVNLGLVISNSEVGKGSVSVMPMLYELSCLNGAVFARQGKRRAHLGGRYDTDLDGVLSAEAMIASDQAFWLAMRDAVKFMSSPSMLDQLVEEARTAQGNKIEGSPIDAEKQLGKQVSLTDSESNSIVESLIRGGNYTQWGLSQAVTHACQRVDDYDRASELEQLGGAIVRLTPKEWNPIAKGA